MKEDNKLSFIFHTAFNEEFSGSSAEDIVQALYENSRSGIDGLTFEAWWAYQQTLWKQRYGASVPDYHAEGSCQVLLDILVNVGALEEGTKPEKPARKDVAHTHG